MTAPRPRARDPGDCLSTLLRGIPLGISVCAMTELRLYAIGIDEVRDMFGAPPEIASTLRSIATTEFAAPTRKSGMLGKLGPLFKRDYFASDDDPSRPRHDDVENLLAGRYVAPDRMIPAWRLVETWLVQRAWGNLRLPASPQQLEALDFDLARAGLPPELALASVFRNDVQVPLRPLSGMRIGYAKYPHVLAIGNGLKRALLQIEGQSAELAKTVEEWVQGFPHWAEVAPTISRPVPDLVGLYLP